ncbi:MAG: NAD(P)-dependent oxidoreductase [Armatimonadetes bacterium]|nr:NAD(P)-dependent oxidoreductase [Armatimonadota bacterium]
MSKRIMMIGPTGKIGKHLVRMLVEMGHSVSGVARFGTPGQEEELQALGVTTYQRDVADWNALDDVPAEFDVVFHMAGLKFGSSKNPPAAVNMNVFVTGRVMEHFRDSGCVLYSSSGNVYPDTVDGCSEDDPVGASSLYATTRMGAEWMVDYFSRRNDTPAVNQRIFYGYNTEFGVPVDIARQVRDGEAVDLTTSYVNVMWLDDLMDVMYRSHEVASVPAKYLNLTGTEKVAVRTIAEKLGQLMGKTPQFTGTPGETALLAKTDEMVGLFGRPKVSLNEGLARVAESVMKYEHPLDHPTMWEKRTGF